MSGGCNLNLLGPRPAGVGPAGLGRPGVEAAPFICSMPRRARGGGCSLHLLYAPAAPCPGVHARYAPACMRAMPLRACALCCSLILLVKVGPAPAPSDSQETGHTLGCARNQWFLKGVSACGGAYGRGVPELRAGAEGSAATSAGMCPVSVQHTEAELSSVFLKV